ncbi:MAG: RagB/SusD family nutrient uptake outer membrane protein [Cytophagales bacterium]|nr:RagB/SusD family nutrient uptake outer membrane protein [Cytophagales bacterium]
MKRVYKILSYTALALTLFQSCADDYLETEPTRFITKDRLDESIKYKPDLLDGTVAGLYSLMVQAFTGGTQAHEDFGQKAYDIYMDMLCGDMELANDNFNKYIGIDRMTSTLDNTSTRNYMPWRYYYRIIFNANIVIDASLNKDGEPKSEDVYSNLGQAQAMRAYAYYYLANLFANEYDPAKKILPIYKNVTDKSVGLSTTQEVYDLILSDLEGAKKYLKNFDRGSAAANKNAINLDVVNGMLAYVYSTVGRYDDAVKAADAVIATGKYEILPMDELTTNGFNNVATESWIWGFDLTVGTGLGLVSWWGQVDYFTYSYAFVGDYKTMDEGLYESMRSTDKRRKQFVAKDGDYLPIYKFYDPRRIPQKQREITCDYVFMRIEEMYLLKAEAAAKGGADQMAREALMELVSKRDTDPAYVSALSDKKLKDEIYKQLRIEMWGEGKSYLAMKRNKATITRKGRRYENGSFSYNDDRLTFVIPRNEIQNNPNID